jgi:hypothetical protein
MSVGTCAKGLLGALRAAVILRQVVEVVEVIEVTSP